MTHITCADANQDSCDMAKSITARKSKVLYCVLLYFSSVAAYFISMCDLASSHHPNDRAYSHAEPKNEDLLL